MKILNPFKAATKNTKGTERFPFGAAKIRALRVLRGCFCSFQAKYFRGEFKQFIIRGV
jgi:hypothetical protein